MFARGTGKVPQIGPGNVARVYDPSPAAIFQVQAAMIAAQNCRPFMYSETANQEGVLDPLWFRTMGQAFQDVADIQPHLRQRDPVPCVAIVYSEKTRFHDRSDLRGLKPLHDYAPGSTPSRCLAAAGLVRTQVGAARRDGGRRPVAVPLRHLPRLQFHRRAVAPLPGIWSCRR